MNKGLKFLGNRTLKCVAEQTRGTEVEQFRIRDPDRPRFDGIAEIHIELHGRSRVAQAAGELDAHALIRRLLGNLFALNALRIEVHAVIRNIKAEACLHDLDQPLNAIRALAQQVDVTVRLFIEYYTTRPDTLYVLSRE